MEFEWDPHKNDENERKHGLSFARVIDVFDDPRHLIEDSTKSEHGEVRGRAIGLVSGRVMTVVFTDRPAGRRIISARRARRDEEQRYDRGPQTE